MAGKIDHAAGIAHLIVVPGIDLEQRAIGPILRLRAERDGGRTYLTTPEATFTFAQANMLSRAVARGLAASDAAIVVRDLIRFQSSRVFRFLA